MPLLDRWLRANPLPCLLVALVALSGAARAATFVVDRVDDANVSACTLAVNDCTLRGAINKANASTPVADTITFDPSVTPTITLGSALPSISDTLTITGPGANVLTVKATTTGAFTVFKVNPGVSASFSGLTIDNGDAGVSNSGNGTVDIANCTISGNTFAGISNNTGGILTVTASTLSNNFTGLTTGNFATSTLTNCTLSGSGNVGVSYGTNGTVSLTHCTVSANNKGIEGSGAITLTDTICAGNSVNINNTGTLTQQESLTSGNPLLDPAGLQNNGGPTLTMMPQPGSPAIDAGVTSTFTIDQRGFPRPVDGGTGSALPDIGAVEALSVLSPPTVSISDATVIEGNNGTTTATFDVCLSATSSQDVTVDYATTNGTATPSTPGTPGDYNDTQGTVTIPAGQTCVTVTVTVNGDFKVECDETYLVNLSNGTNATILDGQGLGTITDDDVPCFSISNVSVTEGNSGTTINAVFKVCLSEISCHDATVPYFVHDGSATAASADYDTAAVFDSDGGTPGVLTIPAGNLCGTITVPVKGDTVVEPTENFFVDLTNAVGATICDSHGIGTITNDDFLPCLGINNVTVIEGNSGTTTITFTVTRSGNTTGASSVQYATANGTATAGSDYVTQTGTLNFGASVTSQSITIVVNGDPVPELNENFFVNLTNPVGATLCNTTQGIGTIINDDKLKLCVSDVQMCEGDGGNRKMYFTIALNYPAPGGMTVTYSTTSAGITNNAATAGSDYVSVTGGTVPIGTLASSVPVGIDIVGNTIPEADETFKFQVTLVSGSPVPVVLTKPIGYGKIMNDDLPTAPWIANESLCPENLTSKKFVEQTWVATYFDSTGAHNLTDCRIRIGTAVNDMQYRPGNNRLYLWDSSTSSWIGGFAPGSLNTITNSAGTLNCKNTCVLYCGNDLIVGWAFIPNGSFIGTRDMRMYCKDNTVPMTAILEKKGTWTVTNN